MKQVYAAALMAALGLGVTTDAQASDLLGKIGKGVADVTKASALSPFLFYFDPFLVFLLRSSRTSSRGARHSTFRLYQRAVIKSFYLRK